MTLPDELNFEAIESLNKAMKPIKLTVEVLRRDDATLLTADIALNFVDGEPRKQNSEIQKLVKNCR